jgi:hypothetical protein
MLVEHTCPQDILVLSAPVAFGEIRYLIPTGPERRNGPFGHSENTLPVVRVVAVSLEMRSVLLLLHPRIL